MRHISRFTPDDPAAPRLWGGARESTASPALRAGILLLCLTLPVAGGCGSDDVEPVGPVRRFVRQDGLGDFYRIQPCIDASSNGDACYVFPGTYRENLRLRGKQILVASMTGPDTTVVDGGQAGPVVQFVDYETRDTVFAGFTLANGKAAYSASPDTGAGDEHGGGIRIRTASPLIQNCVVRDCAAEGNGGGVYCAFTGAQPRFELTVFTDNTAAGMGGGLYVFSGVVELYNCLLARNTAESGGAVSAGFGAQVSMENNTLADNATATGLGGEALTLFNSAAWLTDSVVGHTQWQEDPPVPQVVLQLDRQQPSPGVQPALSLTLDHVALEGGAAGIRYEQECETAPALCAPEVLDPVGGNPLFVSFVDREDDPRLAYYLSQVGGGQDADSPCLDAGSTTAEEAGMAERTTQNGANGHQLPDEGTVDLGYHSLIFLP